MRSINESIICAGFGGQGIMVLGKFLATSGMKEGLNVTWLPSYGAEVRGGTAYSMIKISSKPIADPVVSGASTAIIMNEVSLNKFEKRILKGGLLILNTSLIEQTPKRKDITIAASPLTDEAIKIGNMRVANVIAAGIFAAKHGIFDKKVLIEVIREMTEGHEELVAINIRALERGMELGR